MGGGYRNTTVAAGAGHFPLEHTAADEGLLSPSLPPPKPPTPLIDGNWWAFACSCLLLAFISVQVIGISNNRWALSFSRFVLGVRTFGTEATRGPT